MKEPILATGKKVEDAIKTGLEQLGLTLDEVKVEIISEGGFLKKAQVKLTPDEKLKVEVRESTVKIHTEDIVTIKPKTNLAKTEIKKKKEAEPAAKTGAKKEKLAVKTEKTEIKQEQPKKEKGINEGPKEFIEKFVKFVGADAKVSETQDDNTINIKITGDKMGQFIGNGGETLAAIQTIANVISGKNRAANKRVYVDAGNYKSGKDDRLKEIADKMSKEVLETGESRKLKPMSAYERRIIHAYLQNIDGISTVSKGEEPNRCLIIIPKY